MSDCIAVVTTIDSSAAASKLAKAIVNARLAACVQVSSPVTSVYRWEGAIQEDQEWQLWIKTTVNRFDDLASFIKANHSYDIPEIIALPISAGNTAYLKWITSETSA